MEQREGELVYLKLDMDGADGKALSSQGILAGTEYEYYKPFDDAPEYEEYKEVPKWLKVVAGVAVAAVVGLAVAATAASDQKNGTESSLGDYISNAFSASARVGASCIAITLGMYGEEVMTLTVSGGLGLIPVGGTVVTLPQLAGAFLLVAGTVTSQNLLFQMRGVLMFLSLIHIWINLAEQLAENDGDSGRYELDIAGYHGWNIYSYDGEIIAVTDQDRCV